MKIHGKAIDRPKPEPVILPRNGGTDIVFMMGPVNMGDFNQYCKEPQPPMVLKREDGIPYPDFTDEDYKKALKTHANRKMDWMILESFKATEGIEWETVKLEDPDTWHLWREELANDGFSTIEINQIYEGFMIANSMSEAKLKEARDRFYRSQAEQAKV